MISLIIPTLRRPESLARALRSVLGQIGFDSLIAEVVVVDNSPEASARTLVEALTPAFPRPLVFVHAPRPGVATARNAGLEAASGELIAFLDDDEEAPPHWLGALLEAHRTHGADVTFGAVHGRAPTAAPWTRPYFERLFSRFGPRHAGPTRHFWGCGNSLMTRATALAGPAPFDVARDQSGGEDDTLFRRLAREGRRFVWSPEAWVYEHAPAHRATMDYALKRAFAYGQSPCQAAARRRDPVLLLLWMGIGAGQTLVYGTGALILWLIRHPRRADLFDRTARGVGKLLWMPAFEPMFYGHAEAARTRPEERLALSALPGD